MSNKWKKKIGLFLTSQAISLFGSSLVQYAIIWYITLKTNSGIMMTIATLCAFIPQVCISLFAGVWADKYNKKMLIILSDSIIAVATFCIAILFFMGMDFTWLLFAVLGIRSFGSGVQTPTTNAFIPEVVPEKYLMKVNGINTTIQSLMLIVSPAVSGALLASVELEYIFFIDVITAIIGISIFSFVKVDYKKKNEEKVDYFSSIKEGIIYTKNKKFLVRMFIYLIIANVLITPLATLTPLLVTRTYGSDPIYLTLNEIVFFIGNIIGGIIISSWGGFKNRVHTIALGSIICGIFSIFMGLPISFIVYLILNGITGTTIPMYNTPFITLFQENTDSEMQGRVFSLISMITGVVMPLAMLVFGPLADYFKIEYILIITGILFVLGTFVLMRDKLLIENSVVEKEIEEI